ncbi:TetR/AcrR family transcriptional regulator [Nocardiopsis sp. EMB25]|uniref:TetR/AcrR family transcriptional regulator n=1 Tax=Nocardiopsis sp. EMB25 TaxID=2835867 RepID=UPI002283F794|nr:TetR/AcrR family transcriptional regulator [Nocardiopsis sp. EMB25]MCY9783029.1 TetR/AcrR family transcriptional regulator [Nocardiopsis sp. EMB25]
MGQRSVTGGRPRDAHIDTAVLDAVSALLEEDGYRSLAIEKVARRAGVSKAAVYRRWPNRQLLVLAELERRMGGVEPPRTGCTLCDLDEALALFARTFRCMGPEFFSPLLADCSGDEELHRRFMDTLFDPPRNAVRDTLERARERGDLRDDVDLTLAVDTLASLVHYRLLFGHAPVDGRETARAVAVLLRGLARDFAALEAEAVGHSATSHG